MQFTIDREHDALLVVDPQNDFCSGGSLAVPGGEEIMSIVNSYGQRFQYNFLGGDWHKDPGMHFGDPPDYKNSWPPHCVAGTPGADYHPALDILVTEEFKKGQYSDAYSEFEGITENGELLAEVLERFGIHRIFIVGLATDYCVLATALDAAQVWETIVVLDACRGVAPETTAAAIEEMRAAGVLVIDSLE